jgi:hypothetical protein
MTRAHHVVSNEDSGGWDVRAEGEFEPIRHFREKEKAVEFARELSAVEQTELVIHDLHGCADWKDSHRPNPPWRHGRRSEPCADGCET